MTHIPLYSPNEGGVEGTQKNRVVDYNRGLENYLETGQVMVSAQLRQVI